MKINRFEDILAWQKAINFAVDCRQVFKGCNDFAFLDQLFRAVLSISNNIAEGYERMGDKEFRKFLFIAKGSCGEVRSMLHLAEKWIISNRQNRDFCKKNPLKYQKIFLV